jgi:hypothetical protein
MDACTEYFTWYLVQPKVTYIDLQLFFYQLLLHAFTHANITLIYVPQYNFLYIGNS